jgi:hypothetical protein
MTFQTPEEVFHEMLMREVSESLDPEYAHMRFGAMKSAGGLRAEGETIHATDTTGITVSGPRSQVARVLGRHWIESAPEEMQSTESKTGQNKGAVDDFIKQLNSQKRESGEYRI